MSDSSSPLPPNAPLVQPQAPAPVVSSDRIRCEFCECQLTPTGGAFRLSDRARMLRDQEEEITRLRAQLATAEGLAESVKRDADTLRGQLAELQAAKPAGRGW